MKTQINLLPPELKIKPKKGKINKLLLVIPLIICAGIFFGFNSIISAKIQIYNKKIHEFRVELNSVRHQYSKLKDDIKNVEKIKDKVTSKKEQLKLIKGLKGKKSKISGLFKEISLLIPKNVWLDEMVVDNMNLKVLIKGEAFNHDLIKKFLFSLKKSDYFSNVKLNQSQLIEHEDRSLVSFEIESQIS